MADSILVEGIKLVGGIAGLCTAGYTIWDRTVRSRPYVNMHAPMPTSFGVSAKTLITVHNPGRVDIAIEGIKSSDPNYRASSDDTTMSLLEAFEDIQKDIFVPAGDKRSFMVLDVRPDDKCNRDVRLLIKWRPVTAYLLPRIPIVVRIERGRLEALEKDAVRRHRAAYEEGL